jgi:hypothetical protein
MEGATATFAMFVPEPVAPADLGRGVLWGVCPANDGGAAGGRQVGDVLYSRLLYWLVFWEGNHKKCIFTCVFFQICLNLPQIFLDEIWGKFESNLSENLGTKAQVLRSFNLRCQRITFEWKPRLIKAQVLRSFNHILGPQCNTKPT